MASPETKSSSALTNRSWLFGCFGILAGVTLLVGSAQSQTPAPGELKLLSVKRIWNDAPHNAFTSLIRFNGKWYCTFREARTHAVDGGPGRARVIASDDGERWESVALLSDDSFDVRDPHLSVTPANELMLITGRAVIVNGANKFHSATQFSKDGINWTKPVTVGDPDFWLWSATWHKGVCYSIGYNTSKNNQIRLYRSTDGRSFQPLVANLGITNYPNETSIVFDKDDVAYCLLRPSGPAFLGTSKPPYTDWNWNKTGVPVGGPALIQLPDGRWLAAGRHYAKSRITRLWWADPNAGRLTPALDLPSGGDTSYPGLVWHDGVLWMSYYSSHEDKTSIYLAKVAVADRGREKPTLEQQMESPERQVSEDREGFEGALIYAHNSIATLGDDVFGDVIADFRDPSNGRLRCSHGGPVCMEYANGTIVAFYANTSSHNVDGWSEYAFSKNGGKTWDKYHPFPYSRQAYEKDPKRPVWIEEGLVTEKGTAVLVLTDFANGERVGNSVMRSHDNGATWTDPAPVASEAIGYPAAVAVSGGANYVLFDCLNGYHEFYVSTDEGQAWRKSSTLPLQKDAWYGAMCFMKDGRLLAGAYVTQDENHFYYCISQDAGRTWGEQQKAYLDKKIRDPELASIDGKYYLHGRSGHSGDGSGRFVIYQSDDGIRWKSGVIVSGDKRHPDGYSHNCIINKHDDDASNDELMIQYSIIYTPPRTSTYVFFVKPERQQSR